MITKELFGHMPNGDEVYAYTVKNSNGAYFKLLTLGGIINQLWMPDRDGKLADIVCGYDSVEGYLTGGGYIGAIIGRYGNRIRNGRFTLNGMTYQLALNENGISHLHGGEVGFDKKLWNAVPYEKVGERGVIFTCVAEDMEENYPGELRAKVVYSLTDENKLKIHYEATCDKDTVINMTNHSYFNLDGFDSGSVLNHYLRIDAEAVCEVDETLVVTDKIFNVSGTPFDFLVDTKLGDRICEENEQIKLGGGYDHNFFFKNYDGSIKLQAELYSEKSGRVMSVYTDQPCVQLYSGNMLNEPVLLKGKVEQIPRTALCLETQHAPDSPNHDDFPSAKLRVGEKYNTTTIYAFGVK